MNIRQRIEPPTSCVTSRYSHLLAIEGSSYKKFNNQVIQESFDAMEISKQIDIRPKLEYLIDNYKGYLIISDER